MDCDPEPPAASPEPPSGVEYTLGPDSMPQEGVPAGTVEKRTWSDSRIFPGTTHEYRVYVPAQYADAEPAAVMVFHAGSKKDEAR